CVSLLAAEDQVDAWCADRAIECLEAHDTNRPFAMMVGFPSPHCPYDPPADIAAMFDPAEMPPAFAPTAWTEPMRDWLIANMKRPWADLDYTTFTAAQIGKVRAHYGALIHLVDRAVGRILETVQRLGIADDTVVIFASDHGDFVGDFGMVGKNFFMEGSVRVPLVVAQPGQSPTVRQDTVTLTDLYATFLEIAGLPVRDGASSQSVLAPPPQSSRTVFGATHRGFFAERDRLKLARYLGGDVTLHDVAQDPGEQTNLAGDVTHRAAQAALDNALTDWQIAETLKGHRDKTIVFDAAARAEPDGTPGILGRGWQRPYPYAPETTT
ncbi:MAG: sulfatase-like hydrolase/transferase, partial [Pseudomonadota bacterium]